MDNIKKIKSKLASLPTKPGVYYFYDSIETIIYVGKAASLKNRVRSYFIGAPFDPFDKLRAGSAQGRHDSKTAQLVSRVTRLEFRVTDSVIEALILESNEIKRLMPKYNIQAKDDKSFAYIFLTRENFPRFFVDRINSIKQSEVRPRKVTKNKLHGYKSSEVAPQIVKFGPFTEGESAKKALEILRRIFGFRDCNDRKFNLYKKKNQPCLFGAIKLCPAPCVGQISQENYKKIIHEIILFLSGKKKTLIIKLKKQMNLASRHQKFELAGKIRDKLFALEHIQDVALINEERPLEQLCSIPHRIEAYDISNLSGQFATGSMVVFTDGVMDKKEYRKFRIRNNELRSMNNELRINKSKIKKNHNSKFIIHNSRNDPAMLAQIVSRRLNHPEWPMPDLMLLDGGAGQLSAVTKIINYHYKILCKKLLSQENAKYLQKKDKNNFYLLKIKRIPIIALAKGSRSAKATGNKPTRKGFRLYKNSTAKKIMLDKKLLEHLRDEAHRFAIIYHRKLKRRSLMD